MKPPGAQGAGDRPPLIANRPRAEATGMARRTRIGVNPGPEKKGEKGWEGEKEPAQEVSYSP